MSYSRSAPASPDKQASTANNCVVSSSLRSSSPLTFSPLTSLIPHVRFLLRFPKAVSIKSPTPDKPEIVFLAPPMATHSW